jgi:hypothetical protein
VMGRPKQVRCAGMVGDYKRVTPGSKRTGERSTTAVSLHAAQLKLVRMKEQVNLRPCLVVCAASIRMVQSGLGPYCGAKKGLARTFQNADARGFIDKVPMMVPWALSTRYGVRFAEI